MPELSENLTREDVLRIFRSQEQEALKGLVSRRHPLYDDSLFHWKFVEETYQGGPSWFKKHIFKYFKEREGEYEERVARAYRFNHSREVVDLVNKYIFKASVSRKDDAPQYLKDFWRRSTLHGRKIEHLIRQVAVKSSLFGRPYIVVDSTGKDAMTVAEQRESGARVYAYVISSQNALDMAYDDQGKMLWFLAMETDRNDDSPFSDGAVEQRYRLWTRDYWVLFRIEEIEDHTKSPEERQRVEVVDAGVHGLGAVPVVEGDHILTDSLYKTPGLIDDVAYLDRATANYLSNLDTIINDQTFSQLVIPAQAMMPDEDGDAINKLIELGTKRIFTYDAQAQIAPEFIAPDPKQSGVILDVINKIINEIYHSVGMAGERTKQDNAVGIDNSSGVAKAYDFERMNAMLASKAEALEHIENEINRLVALWNGTELGDDEEYVKYPSNFDVRSLYDEFEIAQRLAVMDAPDMVRREQMKTLIDKLFPRLTDSLIEKMKAEVDRDWPDWLAKLDSESVSLKAIPGEPETADVEENQQGQNNDGDRTL